MRRGKLCLLTAVWFAAIAIGLRGLMIYKGTPGAAGTTPQAWPQNALVALSAKKPLLIMFAHPRCPCTKASLGELEQLVAEAKDKFEAVVLFYEPEAGSEEWSKSALITAAQSIPGVRVVLDKDGSVTKRFDAQTSGQTVVYSPKGKLLFSGGITGSRGHLGDNGGFDTVFELVNNVSSPSLPQQKAEVFGCGIFDRCTSSELADKK